MKERRKAWIQLITGMILLLCMFCIPEFAVLIFIGLAAFYVGKRLWHVQIGTIKRKRR